MSAVETVAGIVTHVGPYSQDSDLCTYTCVELQTDAGLVVLQNLVAGKACDTILSVGADLAITLTQVADAGGKSIVWAVRDVVAGVTAANEGLYAARNASVAQAFFFTLASFIFIPVGLVCLVAPGLYATYLLWRTWSRALAVPSRSEIQSAVDAMNGIRPPVFAVAA